MSVAIVTILMMFKVAYVQFISCFIYGMLILIDIIIYIILNLPANFYLSCAKIRMPINHFYMHLLI